MIPSTTMHQITNQMLNLCCGTKKISHLHILNYFKVNIRAEEVEILLHTLYHSSQSEGWSTSVSFLHTNHHSQKVTHIEIHFLQRRHRADYPDSLCTGGSPSSFSTWHIVCLHLSWIPSLHQTPPFTLMNTWNADTQDASQYWINCEASRFSPRTVALFSSHFWAEWWRRSGSPTTKTLVSFILGRNCFPSTVPSWGPRMFRWGRGTGQTGVAALESPVTCVHSLGLGKIETDIYWNISHPH